MKFPWKIQSPRVKPSGSYSLKSKEIEVQVSFRSYFLFWLASARGDSSSALMGSGLPQQLQPLPSFTGTGATSSGFPDVKIIKPKVFHLPRFLKSPKSLKSLWGRKSKMCSVKDSYFFMYPMKIPPTLVTDFCSRELRCLWRPHWNHCNWGQTLGTASAFQSWGCGGSILELLVTALASRGEDASDGERIRGLLEPGSRAQPPRPAQPLHYQTYSSTKQWILGLKWVQVGFLATCSQTLMDQSRSLQKSKITFWSCPSSQYI